MKLVTLECRNCHNTTEPFAINFFPDEVTNIKDTQYHMDMMFKAACGGCSKINWEVTSVEVVPRNFPKMVK